MLSALRPGSVFKSVRDRLKATPALSTVAGSEDAQAVPLTWAPLRPTPPETDSEVQETINHAYEVSLSRKQGDKFNYWLLVQRKQPRADKDTARELWQARNAITSLRDECKNKDVLENLDRWLRANAYVKLDVGIVQDLHEAEIFVRDTLELSAKNGWNIVENFLNTERQEGIPDILIAEKFANMEWTRNYTGPEERARDVRAEHMAAQRAAAADFNRALNARRAKGPPDPYALPPSDQSEGETAPTGGAPGYDVPLPPEPEGQPPRPSGIGRWTKDSLELYRGREKPMPSTSD